MAEIVGSAFERALALLTCHRDILETAAARLLERETLIEADMTGIATELASAGQESTLPKAA